MKKLLLLIALAGVIVRGAERLYRRSLLQTSGKLSIKQAAQSASDNISSVLNG